MKKLRLLGAVCTCILITHVFSDKANAGTLYIGAGSIYSSTLDGTNLTAITPYVAAARDIEVDTVNNFIYWSDPTSGGSTFSVYRANLDGSNIQTLITFSSSQTRGLGGVELDVSGGKLFFSDRLNESAGNSTIYQANLDGTNVTPLFSTIGNIGALEIAGGKFYWSERSDILRSSSIMRSNLDGTNIETIIPQQNSIVGIEVDAASGRIFWTDQGALKVQSANLDGSNIQVVGGGYRGIAYDPITDQIFYNSCCSNTSSVIRANSDGTGATKLPIHMDLVGLEVLHVVPIPPSAWLFGSGLLGLIGVAKERNIRKR